MKQELAPLETPGRRTPQKASSRLISLRGLPGILAGSLALLGMAALALRFDLPYTLEGYESRSLNVYGQPNVAFYRFLLADALLILAFSLAGGILLTTRQTRRRGLPVWNKITRRVLWNMFIPLSAGGLFCLVLLMHGFLGLVAPACLLFYGLALLHTSKYTRRDIRYLAFSEISLGLLGAFFIGYGLLFWAIGFGLFHILYGTRMYQKQA
ncbi:MAG: hypothetical protein ACO1O1_12910 [Adhaeribacter sp.]